MNVCRIVGDMHRLYLIRQIRMRKRLHAIGLHIGQPPVLGYIATHPGCTQKEAADEMNVTPASVAAQFKRFERSGWIERRADDSDARCKRIYITKEGAAVSEACKGVLHALDRQMLEGFSEDELAVFGGMVARIADNMAGEEYKNLSVFSLLHAEKDDQDD